MTRNVSRLTSLELVIEDQLLTFMARLVMNGSSTPVKSGVVTLVVFTQ